MTFNTKIKMEENIEKSFQLAKKDIYNLYEHFNSLKTEVNELRKKNYELNLQIAKLKPVVATTKKVLSKRYVAAKTGKKVHQANCLFARNIGKNNRVIFRTKTDALNKGYKLCSCLAY